MHVVFGMAADGRAYPAHPGEGTGAIGGTVVGPAGMLDLLAGQLGLSGPPVSPVVRIAAWQAKLEFAANAGRRFYSASLSADCLSTARLLLSWRDDLVECGWTPASGAPAGRIADLAAADRAPPNLPRGRADLLREVLASLAVGTTPGVERVDLIERLALLPPPWRRLMRALSDAGVRVSEIGDATRTSAGGDLGHLRRFLAEREIEPLVGDGSFTILESRTALMAAEAVADWIAHDPDRGEGTVVILPKGDSVLLDHALTRRGLPALGASPRSAQRGALQLLSLAFSVAWSPFDPKKLIELLLLPRPPVDPWAARLLADALSREPGIGGGAWSKAWDRIEAGLAELNDGRPDPETSALWRAWMQVGLHGRSSGMPVEAATAICGRVRRWALETDGGRRDALLLCAVGAAEALSAAFGAVGRSVVTTAQVDGLIDLAIAEGLPDPDHVAQEGGIRSVTRPGALWGDAARVVWWGFSGAGREARQPWTAGEAEILTASGCEIEPDALARRREAFQWEQAVAAAKDALILVTPSMDRGDEFETPPLAHRFAPAVAGPSRETVRVTAEDLLTRGLIRCAGRDLRRRPAVVSAPAAPVAVWSLPIAVAGAVEARGETASSLQDLLECQLRWVLKHVTRLRTGRTHAVPDVERLSGNVAHSLAEAVFRPGEIPDPVRVHGVAAARFDEVVDRIAAPLRLPGSSGQLAFARTRIPDSLSSLAALLAKRDMSVVGMEVERELRLGDLPVRSRIDLVVRDRSGVAGVIDLKWTGSRTWRRREIEEGLAVQLATYSRLVAPSGGAPAGYYLLRQRELLAEAGSTLAAPGLTVGRTLDATWDAVAADRRALTALARDGKGVATGMPGVADHLPSDLGFPPREGVCGICDFRSVCRVTSGG